MKIFKILSILFVLTISISTSWAQEIEVTSDQSLNDAITFVESGGANTIVLATNGGVYYTNPFTVTVPMTIKAKEGLSQTPVIVPQGAGASSFIIVNDDLTLEGIKIDGKDPATGVYDSVKYAMHVEAIAGSANEEPNVIVRNCEVTNIYKYGDPEFSHDGNVFDLTKGARCGTIVFENDKFSNTGDEALRSINTHKDPVPLEGKFCNSFTVRNCTFVNIRGTGIKIEGDGDSTNVDPQILIEDLTFDHCQRRVIWHRDMYYSVIRNILISNSIKGNDDFSKSQALITFQSFGTTVSNIDTFHIQGVKANGDTVTLEYGTFVAEQGTNTHAVRTGTLDETTIYNLDPQYADPANGDYTLPSDSPLLTLGNDGYAIGDRNWTGQLVTAVENEILSIPSNYALFQNYPNPFNPTTNIKFSLPESGVYQLTVYNILGQKVATLLNGTMTAGAHNVTFDASRLSSGVYLYNLKGKDFNQTKKMLLLK